MTHHDTLRTIAVVGPESTGKTELCQALAAVFGCGWIAEYARTYVERLDRPYTYADVEQIARVQMLELRQRQNEQSHGGLLLVDTDLIITKVWFTHVYKQVPTWIDTAIADEKIDFYLLCKPDIAWQYDPVRENEHLRDFLYDWYKREIEQTGTPYAEIGGVGNARTQTAIAAIGKQFDITPQHHE